MKYKVGDNIEFWIDGRSKVKKAVILEVKYAGRMYLVQSGYEYMPIPEECVITDIPFIPPNTGELNGI